MSERRCYCGLEMRVRRYEAYPVPGGDGSIMAKPADFCECPIPGHFRSYLLDSERPERTMSPSLGDYLLSMTVYRFSRCRRRP